ncbi:MAG: hypothetical protein IJS01_14155 [Lentisphaeria bacterium]|nr:hypothetical protein [Lentisphaeria bacterium]
MAQIMTVRGPVETGACGMVLSHEHMFIDLANQAAPGSRAGAVTPADRPALMRDPYCMTDNLKVDGYDSALAELRHLAGLGCTVVADCTLREIGRDPVKLKRLSQESGVDIVMGCGWYTGDAHPAEVAALTAEELAQHLVAEIRDGAEGTGIRPGLIGEIGTSREILPGERKALCAAAMAQRETGLAVQVHVYPWCTNGLEATDILFKYGVPPRRIVICHSDVTPDKAYIAELLRRGVYVQLDNFGKEFTPEPGGFAAGRFITDRERAELAARIIASGFEDQLLLTNDICLKCMLKACGGGGYGHIFETILPLLVKLGVPEKLLKEKILRANPLAMLAK